jgi:hypothetical protein
MILVRRRSSRKSHSSRFVNHLAVAERKAQMGDAGVEVLEETRHERRELPLIGVDEIVAQQRGHRQRGRLVTGAGPDRDLRPLRLGRLASQIPQPVDVMPTSA